MALSFSVEHLIGPLVTAAAISIGGLFLKVTGHEVKIEKVEDAVSAIDIKLDTNASLAKEILESQGRLSYQVCLLTNDKDMSKCAKDY